MNTATLTCPKCGHEQVLEIPNEKCLPFYRCDGCRAVIGVPAESKNCCVVCEYSDKRCPIAHA